MEHRHAEFTSPSLPAQPDLKSMPGTGGFERISINLSQLEIKRNRVTLTCTTGERYLDVAYLALGSTPQHGLARSPGAQCD